jgi:hypothetical protein
MKNTKLISIGAIIGILASTLFFTFIRPTFVKNPPIADISLSDAQSYFLQYRQSRMLAGGVGIDENKTEGYVDFTVEQLDLLDKQVNVDGLKKVRIYSGYDGKSNFLMLNSFDAQGNEITPVRVRTISIGGLKPNDCPKYCEVSRTVLYTK